METEHERAKEIDRSLHITSRLLHVCSVCFVVFQNVLEAKAFTKTVQTSRASEKSQLPTT